MHGSMRPFLAAALCAALASCSGDDDSAPAPLQLADITSASAPTIASGVLVAAFESAELGAFVTGGSTGFSAVKPAPGALLKGGQSSYIQVPVGPETTPCDFGGSVTLTGDIANPLTLSPGDTITMAYAACDDGVSVIDGTFALRITGFSGDFLSGAFSLGLSVDVTAFRVATAADTVTSDGDLALMLNTLSFPTLTASIASNAMAVDSSSGGSHDLSGFTATQTVDQLTGDYTFDAGGTVASSEFTGAVNFDTTEAFNGVGLDYPASGEMLVTGADSGTIRIIALDNVNVRLEVDADGNGVVDSVIDTTWDQLR